MCLDIIQLHRVYIQGSFLISAASVPETTNIYYLTMGLFKRNDEQDRAYKPGSSGLKATTGLHKDSGTEKAGKHS